VKIDSVPESARADAETIHFLNSHRLFIFPGIATMMLCAVTPVPLWRHPHWIVRGMDFPRLQPLPQELDQWWQTQFDILESDMPHSITCLPDDLYGMRVYSHLALEEPEIARLVEEDVLSLDALPYTSVQ